MSRQDRQSNPNRQTPPVIATGRLQPIVEQELDESEPESEPRLLRQNILKQNPPDPFSPTKEAAKPSRHTDYPHEEHSSSEKTNVTLPFTAGEHDFLVTSIIHLNEELLQLGRRMEDLESRLIAAEQSNPEARRKKPRRRAQEIEKNYRCPYMGCAKTYGSEVSLNLHIKLKHNGGTKTEREQYVVPPMPMQKLKMAGLSVEHPKFSLPPEILQSIEEEYQMLNRKLSPQ